jgi:hypothetical protein
MPLILPTYYDSCLTPVGEFQHVRNFNVTEGYGSIEPPIPAGTLRIGGDTPTGVVTLSGLPVARTVDIFDRDTNIHISRTTSSAIDGTFNFSNLSTRAYDIIIRGEAGERDAVIPNVLPVVPLTPTPTPTPTVTPTMTPTPTPSLTPGLIVFDYASRNGSWTLTSANRVATNNTAAATEAAIRLDLSLTAIASTYLEFEIIESSGGYASVGLTNDGDASLAADFYVPAGGYLYYGLNAEIYNNATNISSGIGGYSNTAIIGVCVKGGKLYFSNNGVWTGEPDIDIGALFTGLSGNYWPVVYGYQGGESIRVRLSASEMTYPIPTGCTTILP